MLMSLSETQKNLTVDSYMCGSLLKEAGAIMILKDIYSVFTISLSFVANTSLKAMLYKLAKHIL